MRTSLALKFALGPRLACCWRIAAYGQVVLVRHSAETVGVALGNGGRPVPGADGYQVRQLRARLRRREGRRNDARMRA